MADKIKLVALKRISYGNGLYYPGNELPIVATELSDEWVKSGAAAWVEEQPERALKARPMTAQMGDEGVNVVNAETELTLTGRVPATEARKKPPAKRQTRKKKIVE